MIRITPSIAIEESEIQLEFVRSSGPGGQNVNKISSAVQLRFDLRNTTSLPEHVKQKILHITGAKITAEGILLISASKYRTQEQNRSDAISRFINIIKKSSIIPKKRQPTGPTHASKLKRLESKKHRSEIKKLRQGPPE